MFVWWHLNVNLRERDLFLTSNRLWAHLDAGEGTIKTEDSTLVKPLGEGAVRGRVRDSAWVCLRKSSQKDYLRKSRRRSTCARVAEGLPAQGSQKEYLREGVAEEFRGRLESVLGWLF